MKQPSTNWRFWLFWVLAFLSFPIAGLLATFIGPVTTPGRAVSWQRTLVASRHYGFVHRRCAVHCLSASLALASIGHLDWGGESWLGAGMVCHAQRRC